MVDERQNIVQKTSSGKAWKEGRVDELVAKTNSDIDLIYFSGVYTVNRRYAHFQ